MLEGKKKERTKRVKEMSALLGVLYPNAQMELNFNTDFECLVAVQLSAQCTDKRVNLVTEKLFKKYKTVAAYASANPHEFEQDIFSCGFYKNKTKNILAAAKMIRDDFKGVLPRTLTEMLAVPGVARKTANVVLSTLYGVTDGIAVDTHIRRFAIRFDLSDYKDPVRIEKDLMEIVPKEEWWTFPHRLVLYGRYMCPARPHSCEEHPLTTIYPEAVKKWPKSS